MTHADIWHDALKRAGELAPIRLAATIVADQDNGLRAASYDSDGGRTSRVPCNDGTCPDGPEPHSHHVVNDPTGNAATRGRQSDPGAADLQRLRDAERLFIQSANGALWWVCGKTATSWAGVVRLNATLMPGTIQAGIDVDLEGVMYGAIDGASRAVSTVERIARDHTSREPSTDERHWTAGLADEDCCAWHLELHRRYRRPRVPGTNACQTCLDLAILLGQKPPRWLREAEVDLRESRPVAWRAALSRCMDELGVVRSA